MLKPFVVSIAKRNLLKSQKSWLGAVSNTRGSGWVRSAQVVRCTATHPPATVGGTDPIQIDRVDTNRNWALRPIVLFPTTYLIVAMLHELTHALTAYALHVPCTFYPIGVNVDRTAGTLTQHSAIAASGPLFCLGIGLFSWGAYLKARNSRFGLPFLYVVMFGAGTFFGNLMSTAFVGDFSRLALTLQLPIAVRYSASAAGILLLCGLSFLIGLELRTWAPAEVSAARATIGMIVLPAIVGTGVVVLILLPMPVALAQARIAESTFWIFAAVGTMVSRKRSAESKRNLHLGWEDIALLLLVTLVVRLTARGITFAP